MKVEESEVVAEDDVEEETVTVAVRVTDNVGDPSVEINVEELISELEAEGLGEPLEDDVAAKRRLEEIMERKCALQELEDFDDYKV